MVTSGGMERGARTINEKMACLPLAVYSLSSGGIRGYISQKTSCSFLRIPSYSSNSSLGIMNVYPCLNRVREIFSSGPTLTSNLRPKSSGSPCCGRDGLKTRERDKNSSSPAVSEIFIVISFSFGEKSRILISGGKAKVTIGLIKRVVEGS